MKKFEDLEVYKKSFDFSVRIFETTKNSKINYNISNQLERAALSIPNNIAEGFELQSNKQFVKFLYIAKGSCGECRNLVNIAVRLEEVSEETGNELIKDMVEISKQLSNFIKYLNNSEIR